MEDNANNSARTNGTRRLLAAATVVVLAALSTVPAAAAGQSAPGRQASVRHTSVPAAAQRHDARGELVALTPVARDCAADLAKHGVGAPVIDQGATSHNETYLRSGPQIVRWFDAAARR
ncbi:hypothetical protein AB0C40_10345 [Streptomyces brevispora]|uniref:hypothetical protein n=1 Tax=Streptomyces brevispora TaxID=887462 RepID=UPI0033F4D801